MRQPPDIWRGIAKNALLLSLTVVATSFVKNGPVFWSSWQRAYIVPGILFLLLAAAVIWMRWEWAPYEAARRKAKRKAENN